MALWVCAPQSASAGTWTSPRLSFSILSLITHLLPEQKSHPLPRCASNPIGLLVDFGGTGGNHKAADSTGSASPARHSRTPLAVDFTPASDELSRQWYPAGFGSLPQYVP